jgi:hypothetical protein
MTHLNPGAGASDLLGLFAAPPPPSASAPATHEANDEEEEEDDDDDDDRCADENPSPSENHNVAAAVAELEDTENTTTRRRSFVQQQQYAATHDDSNDGTIPSVSSIETTPLLLHRTSSVSLSSLLGGDGDNDDDAGAGARGVNGGTPTMGGLFRKAVGFNFGSKDNVRSSSCLHDLHDPSIRQMSFNESDELYDDAFAGTTRPAQQRRPADDNEDPQGEPKQRSACSHIFHRLRLGPRLESLWTETQAACTASSTYIGSFMYLLFVVVFCLTIGATITRPHGTASMLGLFTKMAAIGIVFGSPIYWYNLPDIPALYPTVDLFTAPFLANIAMIIDQELFNDESIAPQDIDDYFLTTFTFVVSLSLFLSGALLLLASVFKLANLGSFLPFPVLCGFFSAVSVLTWTLAFKIDAGGRTITEILQSGDSALWQNAVLHHAPSVLVAVAMKWLGPKNPFSVISLVLVTVGLFYTFMWLRGILLEEMTEQKWFYGHQDLVYEPMYQPVRDGCVEYSFSASNPPAFVAFATDYVVVYSDPTAVNFQIPYHAHTQHSLVSLSGPRRYRSGGSTVWCAARSTGSRSSKAWKRHWPYRSCI